MIYFTTMKMNAKFQDSCFDFICWAMASARQFKLECSRPIANEGSNVSFSNEKRVLVSSHPNDLTLKPILLIHRC